MDESETRIDTYLRNLDIGPVVYEPDGNVPPDFVVNGTIAVEVRRLNQNFESEDGYEGLDTLSQPLGQTIINALANAGPPIDGVNWYVLYRFGRPIRLGRELRRALDASLRKLRDVRDLEGLRVHVGENLRLRFRRAGKTYDQRFVLGASTDSDSGGFVIAEMARNLQICIAEKTIKIGPVQARYPEWWLAFDDRISYGDMDAGDREQLRSLLDLPAPWRKIILISPLEPTRAYELTKR
jgi:hypothetical protein